VAQGASHAPGLRERRARAKRRWRSSLGDVAPVLAIFLGTLALLIILGLLLPDPETILEEDLIALLFTCSLLVLGGLTWIALHRREDEPILGQRFAGRTAGSQLGLVGLGLAAGAAALALNLAWMLPLGRALGEAMPSFAIPEAVGFALLATAVGPAIGEEFAYRGVLWSGLARHLEPVALIVTTATLFSLVHGLNGGGFMELPPRFLLGLVLGWLRWRTGSLTPAIAAHFSNNALAVFLGS